jgi:hypothetical protein
MLQFCSGAQVQCRKSDYQTWSLFLFALRLSKFIQFYLDADTFYNLVCPTCHSALKSSEANTADSCE